MSNNKSELFYLPGLNGLRFIAALLVIIIHIEMLKEQLGFNNNTEFVYKLNLGGIGVYFFFVLSGFLITILLLKEKQKTKTISIKKFYFRRIFRIWPVYYLLMILGFFVFPFLDFFHINESDEIFNNYWTKFTLYLFILPNLCISIFSSIPHIGQSWSIGVEEQFYLFWPLIIRRSKNILRTISLSLFIVLLIKVIIVLLPSLGVNIPYYNEIKLFVGTSKFECMAIGAYAGYFLYNRSKYLKYIYNNWLLVISIIALPFINFYCPPFIQDGVHLISSFLFIIIILNVSSNPNSFVKLENKVFNFLGQISYGLYMYHLFVVVFVIKIIALIFNVDSKFNLTQNILIYSCTILLTVLLSYLSYNYFEKVFLKLKHKFAVVKSSA